RLVTADCDVLFDIVRIDEPAIAENDLLLSFEKRNIAPQRHFWITGSVSEVAGDVVPLLDFAENEIGGYVSGRNVMKNAAGIICLYALQNDQRMTGQADADQSFLEAGAETADGGQHNVHPAVLDRFRERLVNAFGSVSAAACTHSYGDARDRRKQFG